MAYYTLKYKMVECPFLKTKIVVSGKYYYTQNPDNPNEIEFRYATCPIVENSKLPKDDQEQEYKYLDCFHPNKHCELLNDFPNMIDVSDEL